MSHAPSLANAVINLQALRESSRRELMSVASSLSGKKALVFDPHLLGPLDHIVELRSLQSAGVEKFLKLSAAALPTDVSSVLYLVRPRMELMRDIAAQIHASEEESGRSTRSYHVYFVPRRTLICERVLEEEGVCVNVGEFNLNFIPFEDDVLSMELESSFRECYLEGDRSSLYHVARGLVSLQHMFGTIPHIKGKGDAAKQVYDLMTRMRKELPRDVFSAPPEIDTLFLFDRAVDLVTPMITQLTYEGLIDEIFGISHGYTEFETEQPAAATPATAGADGSSAPAPVATRKQRMALNNNDQVFSDIRNVNFVAVGKLLNAKALYINENYEGRHNLQTVSEIRDFVKRFPHLQEEHKHLGLHIQLAQRINEVTKEQDFRQNLTVEQDILLGENEKAVQAYIEELIDKQDSLSRVLRLLCLWSLTTSGLKQKTFEFFRKELVQAYGYESILTLYNLEKMGLLRRQEGNNRWSNIRRSLRLLVLENRDDQQPADISYVCSGYAPMSVRILEATFGPGGFNSIMEPLRMLPGAIIAENQELPPNITRPGEAVAGAAGSGGRKRKVVLVMFIGGVTYAEIAALRFLSRQEDSAVDFVIATTKIISGKSLLQSLYEDVGNMSTRG